MVSLSLIRFTVTRIETQGSLLVVGKPACVLRYECRQRKSNLAVCDGWCLLAEIANC
jgi:hypothetical protein